MEPTLLSITLVEHESPSSYDLEIISDWDVEGERKTIHAWSKTTAISYTDMVHLSKKGLYNECT